MVGLGLVAHEAAVDGCHLVIVGLEVGELAQRLGECGGIETLSHGHITWLTHNIVGERSCIERGIVLAHDGGSPGELGLVRGGIVGPVHASGSRGRVGAYPLLHALLGTVAGGIRHYHFNLGNASFVYSHLLAHVGTGSGGLARDEGHAIGLDGIGEIARELCACIGGGRHLEVDIARECIGLEVELEIGDCCRGIVGRLRGRNPHVDHNLVARILAHQRGCAGSLVELVKARCAIAQHCRPVHLVGDRVDGCTHGIARLDAHASGAHSRVGGGGFVDGIELGIGAHGIGLTRVVDSQGHHVETHCIDHCLRQCCIVDSGPLAIDDVVIEVEVVEQAPHFSGGGVDRHVASCSDIVVGHAFLFGLRPGLGVIFNIGERIVGLPVNLARGVVHAMHHTVVDGSTAQRSEEVVVFGSRNFGKGGVVLGGEAVDASLQGGSPRC